MASTTDVARAAAGEPLAAPGLVGALTAVQISWRIYQRMLGFCLPRLLVKPARLV